MSHPVQVQVFRGGQLMGHVVLDGSKKVNKIGKTSSSQIKLDDPQASRVHAVIEVSRTGAWLIDMGSAVGTLLNGTRINKAKLSHGDQITIGGTVLAVTIGGELAASPPVQQPVVAPQPQQAPMPAPQQAPPPMPGQPASLPPQQAQPMSAQLAPQQSQAPMPGQPAPPQAQPMATLAPQQGWAQQPAQPTQQVSPQTAPMQPPPQPAPQQPAAQQPLAEQPAASMAGPPPSSLGPLQAPPQPATNGARPAAFGPATPTGAPPIHDVDGTLSDSDPAFLRLQQGRRRNRMIAGGAMAGALIVLAAFVYLGGQGEGPDVAEPSNYSGFGVKGEPAAGTEGAEGATAEGAEGATPESGGVAFDSAEVRDESTYLYEKLATAQTFAALAERFYGDGGRVSLLTGANPLAPADQPVAAGTEVRVPRYVIHEVVPGNTLGGIAESYLGDGKLYEKVFHANRDQLSSPTAIDVGMKLKIPILQE